MDAFIVKAICSELVCKKKESAFKRLQDLPPAFPEITDPVAFVDELRKEGKERLTRELQLENTY